MIEIKFSVRKIFGFMVLCVIFLIFFNLIFFYLESKGIGSFRFNSLFYLNEESNIPTYFSGLNLFFASIITFCLGSRSDMSIKTTPMFWRILSIIFIFLSFDEVAMFHERIYRVTVLFTEYFNTPLVWYIPYSLLTLVVIFFLLKNFLRLDFQSQLYIGLSALIFLTGAIGMEHVSNNCASLLKINCSNFLLFMLSSVEETFEMISICLFNYAGLKLFSGKSNKIFLKIKT